MRDILQWSLPISSGCGIRVRLHALFLIATIAMLHLALEASAASSNGLAAFPMAGGYLYQFTAAWSVFFVSVLVHELAHVAVARRVGGGATHQIVLWPLGGLTTPGHLQKALHDLAIGLAGPAANLCLALVALVLLYGTGADLHPVFQWQPPLSPNQDPGTFVLSLLVWFNGLLAAVNLMPASPFDGARVLRAVFGPQLGFRRATLLVARIAFGTSALVFAAGWILQSQGNTWPAFACSAVAMIVAFSAWSESKRLTEPPPETAAKEVFQWSSLGGLELQPEHSFAHTNTWLQQWWQRRQADKARRAREQEEADERRMDDILARICETGLDKLPAEDKALLDRVSARYRQRAQR